ncbi:alpha/beta fold hydrolase [Candidatus Woesearchaeota archaeon]|nr:alpha/beta fold hydrolase [Candidatus Woesearchaeota archaeon]
MKEGVKIKRIHFFNSRNQKLVGILNENETGRIVVICHGFTSSKNCNFIPPLADYLCDNGHSVLRFDFTGNGESEGELCEGTYSQENNDLKKVIDFVKKLNYKKISVIGHSMGGAVAILRASEDERINCLITISAVAYPGRERLTGKQKDDLKKKGHVHYWGKYRIDKNFIDDASCYDLTKYISKVKVPVLIVHGDKDDVVVLKEGRDIYKNANNPKQLEVIKNAGHEFGYVGNYKKQKETSEYKIMKEKILDFLRSNV